MQGLSSLEKLDPVVDQVKILLQQGRSVWVVGAAGTGRSVMSRRRTDTSVVAPSP